MIILKSKNAIVMRVPKTGSTSLETAIRMSGCLADGDIGTSVEDSFLPELNIPEVYTAYRENQTSLRSSIRQKRQAEEPLTAEEQAFVDKAQANRQNNTFHGLGLHHGTLDDLTNTESLGSLGILTEEQIYSFNHYAVLRHPLKRLISGIVFAHNMRNGGRTSVPLVMSDFHTQVLEQGLRGLVYRKQIDYFTYKGETHHNGNRIVTPVIFEDYTNEVNTTITALGGTPLAEIPKFKSQHASRMLDEDKPTIETWLDPYPDVKQVILDFYAEDIALWEEVNGQSI